MPSGVTTVVTVLVGLLLGVVSGFQRLMLPGASWLVLLCCLAAGVLFGWWGRSPRAAVPACAALVAVRLGVAVADGVGWSGSAAEIAESTAFVLAVLVPVLATEAGRRRREYAAAGWQLARARRRERSSAVAEAVAEERAAMAAEIHDGLGHRITLVAVHAGRLSLDPRLDEETRAELRTIRATAADAAEELGSTVDLLVRSPSPGPARIDGMGLDDLVASARAAGLVVTARLPADLVAAAGADTRAAVLRVVREGLTNAARYADGSVELTGDVDDGVIRVRLVNPVVPGTEQPTAGRGHGLAGLRYRVGLLGGSVSSGTGGTTFVLEARIPVGARRPAAAAHLVTTTEDPHRDLDLRRRAAVRAALGVPLGVVAGAGMALAGVFVVVTVASALPAERAAQLRIGQPRAEAERLLPPVEMLEAPRDALPEPAGASCRFYEETPSFFRRDDVHRVCVDGDRVVALDTVPAP